jgi:hypothetical protein
VARRLPEETRPRLIAPKSAVACAGGMMIRVSMLESARKVADEIPGYDYGSASVAKSPVTTNELEEMQKTAGFTDTDERWLRTAGEVLEGQTEELVAEWRAAIAQHVHLARYSLGPDGQRDVRYSEQSALRFRQWILDTCFRPYDQDWLNYQREIALRHTTVEKNRTDGATSAPYVPLRHVIAFAAVVNDPNIMRRFLGAKGDSAEDVDRMHQAWCRSVLIQVALWAEPYTKPEVAPNQW